jgi:hypothetical protein
VKEELLLDIKGKQLAHDFLISSMLVGIFSTAPNPRLAAKTFFHEMDDLSGDLKAACGGAELELRLLQAAIDNIEFMRDQIDGQLTRRADCPDAGSMLSRLLWKKPPAP